jgi:hypothetical protein
MIVFSNLYSLPAQIECFLGNPDTLRKVPFEAEKASSPNVFHNEVSTNESLSLDYKCSALIHAIKTLIPGNWILNLRDSLNRNSCRKEFCNEKQTFHFHSCIP